MVVLSTNNFVVELYKFAELRTFIYISTMYMYPLCFLSRSCSSYFSLVLFSFFFEFKFICICVYVCVCVRVIVSRHHLDIHACD